MSKQVYISADYAQGNGDCEVVDVLNKIGKDNYHVTDFIDMSKVVSGSVSKDPDCRICDLKREFNRQINASSAIIFIVGDKTASRTAGSACDRCGNTQNNSWCTPYKHNSNGTKRCKVSYTFTPGEDGDFGNINSYSYLRHEFEQARKKKKKIIIFYNSTRKEEAWLPTYMKDYKNLSYPFWIYKKGKVRIENYMVIKEKLGF